MGSHFSKKDVFSGAPVKMDNVSTEGVFSELPVELGNDETSLKILLGIKQGCAFNMDNQIVQIECHLINWGKGISNADKELFLEEKNDLADELYRTKQMCDQIVAKLRKLGVDVVNPRRFSAVRNPRAPD